jgi:sugar lactone lactonase YvrE
MAMTNIERIVSSGESWARSHAGAAEWVKWVLRSLIRVTIALIFISAIVPAYAWDRGRTETFAILPRLPGNVPVDAEGLTVGLDGTVYTPSFGFNSKGAVSGPPHLFSFKPNGELVNNVALVNPASTPQPSTNLVGLVYQTSSKTLLICDLAQGIVWQASPITGKANVFMDTGLGSASGLNGLTFDKAGNIYVADSLQGVIWTTGPNGGAPTVFADSQILSPETVPEAVLLPSLGANGVEFNSKFTAMYVSNTAYHSIVQVPVSLNTDGSVAVAGAATILATGINAPDGIAVDRNDNLWIAANQEDEIDVVDPAAIDAQGQPLPKVVAKRGDFDGVSTNGTIQGLLFPTSLAFSPDQKILYVSNLALFQPYTGVPEPAIDSSWTLQIKHYTVARIRTEGLFITGSGH